MAVKKHNTNEVESIKVKLDKEKFPKAFRAKVAELMLQTDLDQATAEKYAGDMEIELEIYYSPELGMFAVDSEAIECADIVDPYTGKMMQENKF